jgi:hypothetical protein
VRFDQRRSGNDEIGITRDFIPRNAAPIGAADDRPGSEAMALMG